jgi:undecaprenyl diphosphate synthase
MAGPVALAVPAHVAIIMDGNGRWARSRFLPRAVGHAKGSEAVRALVKNAAEQGIAHLTLFAFSSENWRRPEEEVSRLMQLFVSNLENQVEALHEAKIRLRVVGDRAPLGQRLQELIAAAEARTARNNVLTLTIAVNYGGRWDIAQAVNAWRGQQAQGGFAEITEEDISRHLCLADLPEPDLFIRTGGEQRISNFLLWNLAYTELYFTDTLWPDFDGECLKQALDWFRQRERRFGRTSEQLSTLKSSLPSTEAR